jgi:hypothetical protein
VLLASEVDVDGAPVQDVLADLGPDRLLRLAFAVEGEVEERVREVLGLDPAVVDVEADQVEPAVERGVGDGLDDPAA